MSDMVLLFGMCQCCGNPSEYCDCTVMDIATYLKAEKAKGWKEGCAGQFGLPHEEIVEQIVKEEEPSAKPIEVFCLVRFGVEEGSFFFRASRSHRNMIAWRDAGRLQLDYYVTVWDEAVLTWWRAREPDAGWLVVFCGDETPLEIFGGKVLAEDVVNILSDENRKAVYMESGELYDLFTKEGRAKWYAVAEYSGKAKLSMVDSKP